MKINTYNILRHASLWKQNVPQGATKNFYPIQPIPKNDPIETYPRETCQYDTRE